MAKKKGKKKGKRYERPAKKAPAFSGAARRAAAGKGTRPRSQTLPGMEQVRSQRLDSLCEDIADARQRGNAAKSDEAGSVQAALQDMQKSTDKFPNGRTVYKHAGVELARIPGADKLRVRLTKEQGDADDDDQVGDERRDAVDEIPTGDAGSTEIH